jgi:phage terminase small subunit
VASRWEPDSLFAQKQDVKHYQLKNIFTKGESRVTSRQQSFLDHYLKTNNPTSAAVSAGYSERSAKAAGRRLLRVPKIAEIITQKSEAIATDWVIREAKRTYVAAHEAGSLSTAVSCLNLIGKHIEPSEVEAENELKDPVIEVVTGIKNGPGSVQE